MAEKSPRTFETSLKELEKIVNDLEKGELPLEDQLKVFERGVLLCRECLEELESTERKVETLLNESGKIRAVPFEQPPA